MDAELSGRPSSSRADEKLEEEARDLVAVCLFGGTWLAGTTRCHVLLGLH